MSDALLTTTSTGGLKPLGSAPQRSYELITGTLRERLSDAHAQLFAEPVTAQHGDRFDWYAPLSGNARRLGDIPAEDQGPIRAYLAELVADIRALAETYGEAGGADDGRLGEALTNALEIPSEASIYVVGDNPGQPVLVHWAWIEDHQRAVRGVLSAVDHRRQRERAEAAAIPVAPTAVVAREPMSWGWLMWLGWLILALMIAWILFLLTEACGLRGPAWLSFCPGGGPVASASASEALVLRDEVARLEQRLADLDQACQPAPPSPRAKLAIEEDTPPAIPLPLPAPAPAPRDETTTEAPEEPPGAVRVSELDRRLAETGADQGALTFSLGWGSTANLNLEVACPSGDGGPESCGGTRDVGANDTPDTAREDPVENVFFADTTEGTYRVRVHLADGAEGDHSFELRVRTNDGIRTLRGSVSPSRPEWIYSHVVTG